MSGVIDAQHDNGWEYDDEHANERAASRRHHRRDINHSRSSLAPPYLRLAVLWPPLRSSLNRVAWTCRFVRIHLLILLVTAVSLAGLLYAFSALQTVTDAYLPSASIGVGQKLTGAAHLPSRPIPMESHLDLLKDDARYLEAWVAHGYLPAGLNLSGYAHVDGLWYWVNGSDPRHRAARAFFASDPTRRIESPFRRSAGSKRRPSGHLGRFGVPSRHESRVATHRQPHGDHSLSETPSHALQALQNGDLRFREQDELRYSLRSAKASLGPYLRTSHIVTADFWPSGLSEDGTLVEASRRPEDEDNLYQQLIAQQRPMKDDDLVADVGQYDTFAIEQGMIRCGQVPQWLDMEHPSVRVGARARLIEDGPAPQLRLHHHWHTFTPLDSIDPAEQALRHASLSDSLEYKLRVLPTFNSMAVEASLGLNVTDLAETFFYSNDDAFFGRKLSPADFSSPLYGPMLQIDRHDVLYPNEHPAPDRGEHPSIFYSAWLLAERFGHRGRHYPIHIQKTHSRPLLLEARLMWGAEFAVSSGRRFRGDGRATSSNVLSYHFIIERHREALLWSFLIAKLDANGDGIYDEQELRRAWFDLGVNATTNIWDEGSVSVPFPQRETIQPDRVADNLGKSQFPLPLEARILFSSQDGYSLADIRMPEADGEGWPQFHTGHSEAEIAASMEWSQCWPARIGTDPIALFTHMAFVKTDCGDSLITLLTSRQGKKGQHIFLPDMGLLLPVVSTNVEKDETAPHLPLNAHWNDADFTLQAVARNTGWPGLSRRTFAMLLIQRYAYCIAHASFKFDMLRSPDSARETFEAFRAAKEQKNDGQEAFSFILVNDDIESGVNETVTLMKGWMESAWPKEKTRLDFEK